MQKTLLLLAAFAAGLAFGETTKLRRGEFTLTCTVCPKCPMRLRFSPDGKQAFLNTSKVPAKERDAVAERAFALMAKAGDTKKGGALRPLMGWSSWNTSEKLQVGRYIEEEMTRFGETNAFLLALNRDDLGLSASVVRREGEAYVLVKDADERFGKSRFLAFYNAGDTPHDFNVPFASLDLGGRVQIMDLGERAELGAFESAFAATVPAHSARFYRLDAETRLGWRVAEVGNVCLAEYQAPKEKAPEKLPECSLTVTPKPGDSHVSKSGPSRLIQSGNTLGSNTGSKTITRSLKWGVETRFREDRPEKLELKAFYLGNNDKNKLIQLGTETKTLTLDKNGRASIELTSPTTRLTKSRTTTTSRHSGGSNGFRSTKTTTRGERVTGCVLQLYADGKLVKSWSSDSRWANEAKKEAFSIENLNKNSGKIGLR